MPIWIATLVALSTLWSAPGWAADDAAIGRAIGEAGSAVVDGSREAYEQSRDFALETGRAISDGAREAYEEARDVGPRIVEDIKDTFRGGGAAQAAPDDTRPVPENR